MVKIRLSRGGVRRKPFYRIVAIEEGQKGQGVPLETLGFWQPSKDVLKVDKEKIKNWLVKGAKLSKAVSDLLEKK